MNILRLLTLLLLILCGGFPLHAFASKSFNKIIIHKSTTYRNLNIDLTNTSFEIVNNATLTLEKCKIKATLSPDQPLVFDVKESNLILKNNNVSITTLNLPTTPNDPSNYYLIRSKRGNLTIAGNKFEINTAYTAGFLSTENNNTEVFEIMHNNIKYFHGGIFLKKAKKAYIGYNKFANVSISNIFINQSSNSIIENNDIQFAGNNNVGDAIDIIDSKSIALKKNYIASGSCYSILILHSKSIILDRNIIVGGITYAISIQPSLSALNNVNKRLISVLPIQDQQASDAKNVDIRITNNYIAQNRYGIMAINVTQLTVNGNIFSQFFSNNAKRKFWTNNDVLLQNVTNVNWFNNRYKEAYPQYELDNEAMFAKFVDFPARGGVSL